MSGNSNTIVDNVYLTPGGVFDQDSLPPTVDIPAGEQGPVGPPGASVSDVTESIANNIVTLNFILTDGTSYPVEFTIPDGTPGMKGDMGDPGVSVTDIDLNDLGDGSYTFTITLSSGDPITTDPFTPAKGDTGDSAYQIALDNGFVGTEAQWIESLDGMDGAPAPTITSVAVTDGVAVDSHIITLTMSDGSEIASDEFTFAVVADVTELDQVGNVDTSSKTTGQALVYDGNNWVADDINKVSIQTSVTATTTEVARQITVVNPDGTETIYVFDSITPVTPGVPTGAFSPTGATQYDDNFPASVTLTLTADPDTNSFFSVDGSNVTMVANVLLNGTATSLWTASIAASAQPTSITDTSVTTLPIVLTPQAGANQVSGTLRIIVDAVVDNETTAGSTTHETVGFNFPITAAATATMTAGPNVVFDFRNSSETTTHTTNLFVSSGAAFVGTPTILSSSAAVSTGPTTDMVGGVHSVLTIAKPADGAATQNYTVTWTATAQPDGATGTNGQVTTIAGNPVTVTIIADTASEPAADGTPPAETAEDAFNIPANVDFTINSASDLGPGGYIYIPEVGGSFSQVNAVAIAGSSESSTTLSIPGTDAYAPAPNGYALQNIQIGYQANDGTYTVVGNLEDILFTTSHPILLWYNQTVTTPAELTALYPGVTLDATEVITPSSNTVLDKHTFTPTSGNFMIIFIPDTWNTVTAIAVVGDGNDQPAGVTVLPAASGPAAMTDDFGTSVQYQGFYVNGITPNVRLRIDSITTS